MKIKALTSFQHAEIEALLDMYYRETQPARLVLTKTTFEITDPKLLDEFVWLLNEEWAKVRKSGERGRLNAVASVSRKVTKAINASA